MRDFLNLMDSSTYHYNKSGVERKKRKRERNHGILRKQLNKLFKEKCIKKKNIMPLKNNEMVLLKERFS